MYPLTIIDNFFEEPDRIVEQSKQYEFKKTDGRWPGIRTDLFGVINPDLNRYIAEKLGRLFYFDKIADWRLYSCFQKCPARHEDQWHPKNRGWIHLDGTVHFGGIIFLDKNPVEDTGTSIYRLKYGHHIVDEEANSVKYAHFLEEDVPDDVYVKAYNRCHDDFEETVKVENVYNRLMLFNNQTYHGVQTYGTMDTDDRLTIAFFGMFHSWEQTPPLQRL